MIYSSDKSSSDKSTAIRLLQLLQPYKWQVTLSLLALLSAAFATVCLGVGLRQLIDEGFALQDKNMLNYALIGMLFVVVLLSAVSFMRATVSSWIGERLATDLRKRLFSHLLDFEPNFFDQNRIGDLVSRIQSDTTVIRILFGGSATTGLRSLLQFIGAMAMLFWTSYRLAALTCLIIPLTFIPIYFFGLRVKSLSKNEQALQGKLSMFCEEHLSAVTTLQSFQGINHAKTQFNKIIDLCVVTAFKQSVAKGVLSSLIIALVFGAISIVLWSGSHQVLAGNLSGGELTAFVFYAVLAAGSVNSLSEVVGHWNQAVGASQRLFDLLDEEPSIISHQNTKSFNSTFKGDISFSHVCFRYPTRHDSAVHNVSFTAKKGDTIAIVGPSGSGKTTLFKLLQRFYDPDEGVISIDDINLKDLPLSELRRKIAWVPQDPFIFSGTIQENLLVGNLNATQNCLIAACQKASIYNFIKELPDGFETILGEKGIRLSGGQKQRLAIARAILKNADILLLDEATNALDAENENIVNAALTHLMKGRTTLVVAHRLSTVLRADKIIVLDKGSLISQGRHNVLLEECALYRRHAKLQFHCSTSPNLEAA